MLLLCADRAILYSRLDASEQILSNLALAIAVEVVILRFNREGLSFELCQALEKDYLNFATKTATYSVNSNSIESMGVVGVIGQ